MRFLLILFAVLGLLANPVSAAAAQAACNQAMSSASTSDTATSGMAGMPPNGAPTATMPACCDHAKGHPAKSCAQLCAAICAVDAAIDGPTVSAPFVLTAADHAPARFSSVHPFEPARAERPPRAIA